MGQRVRLEGTAGRERKPYSGGELVSTEHCRFDLHKENAQIAGKCSNWAVGHTGWRSTAALAENESRMGCALARARRKICTNTDSQQSVQRMRTLLQRRCPRRGNDRRLVTGEKSGWEISVLLGQDVGLGNGQNYRINTVSPQSCN